MRKFYVLSVVFVFLYLQGSAQEFFWVGPNDGSWNDAANWSATSGGTGGAGVPNSTSANVTFNTTSRVILSAPATVQLSTLTVTGGATVRITASGAPNDHRSIELNSVTEATPGLKIDAGSRLEDSAVADVTFDIAFVPDGKGLVNGEWYFTGTSQISGAFFTLPTTGGSTALNINSTGKIIISPTGFGPLVDPASQNFLKFNSGSTLHFMSDGAFVPVASYHSNSTILFTGNVLNQVGFDMVDVGNLTYDCPGQTINVFLNLGNSMRVLGDVNVLNTNGKILTILSNDAISPGIPTRDATIGGDLEISGNSHVAVSFIQTSENNDQYNLYVEGNIVANGLSFSIQSTPYSGISATTVFVEGNIQHLSGTFEPQATEVNESTNLYNLELNGSLAAQTIYSHNGRFDNGNDQFNLRINNSLGVTLLSPLLVGRLSFTNGNTGNLNTNGNILTVNNASNNALALSRPANSGFVNGILRRRTLSADPTVFPVGSVGAYKEVAVKPSTAEEGMYEASYTNSAYAVTTAVSPLEGTAPYYWEIKKILGTSASVILTLTEAVAGAEATDVLVVARFNGTGWERAKGATGTFLPGSSTSGTVMSEVLTAFSPFSIGYGSDAVLPINLVSFNGRKTGNNTAVITWTITENSTPSGFEILKSTDGVNFKVKGTLHGLESKLAYEFADNELEAGNNFYRLKMFDKDGSVSFSNIIVLMNGNKGVLITSMIPTMVRDRARVNISSSVKGTMQLVITDINGRIVSSRSTAINTGNQEVWIEAGKLMAGMFQITGYMNGEKTATIRFIKQ